MMRGKATTCNPCYAGFGGYVFKYTICQNSVNTISKDRKHWCALILMCRWTSRQTLLQMIQNESRSSHYKKNIADGGSVILMSHFGRPKDGPEEKSSLKHLVKHLSELLGGTTVLFAK